LGFKEVVLVIVQQATVEILVKQKTNVPLMN